DFAESCPVAVSDLSQVDPDAVGLDHRVLAALRGQNRRGDALDELLATPLRKRTEYARRTFGDRDGHAVDRLRVGLAADEHLLLVDEAPREGLQVRRVPEVA